MKHLILGIVSIVLFFSCGSNKEDIKSKITTSEPKKEVPQSIAEGKGIGEIKEVKLNDPLDQDMVKRGQSISDMKCAACHRYTAQRVVGPGWAGITSKRKPEWIMNMITNVEAMLEEDPTAQALLEECLTRMPNQNLSIGDARDVLEFMYKNDADQAAQ